MSTVTEVSLLLIPVPSVALLSFTSAIFTFKYSALSVPGGPLLISFSLLSNKSTKSSKFDAECIVSNSKVPLSVTVIGSDVAFPSVVDLGISSSK